MGVVIDKRAVILYNIECVIRSRVGFFMAKKVAASQTDIAQNKGKVKKKHGKCFTCCMTTLVIFVVFLAAAFGVGWYFGDKYTKQMFGMSLGDTLGVLGDLYWTDDSDVVKNPYNNNDLNDVYKEIKRNIFLRADADVNFEAALEKALGNFLGDKKTQPPDNGGGPGSDTGTGDTAAQDGSNVMNVIVDMIAEIMKPDSIDVELLSSYDADNPETDKYIFELKDKYLAAFLNVAVKAMFKIDGFNSVGGVSLGQVLSVKQVCFRASQATEAGVIPTQADVTLWIGLQSAAGQAIKSMLNENGFGWASGFAAWLGDVFLPENIYITMGIPLNSDEIPDFVINDMNASERARAKKLINGILKLTGGESTFDEMLVKISDKIKPFLEKAVDKMSFDKVVSDHMITLDLLDIMTKMASENIEGEALTKPDLIYVMQGLLSDRAPQLKYIEPYRYENRYLVNGKDVYSDTVPAGGVRIDYENEFKKLIAQKYALDIPQDSSLTDVLAMFGISLDGSSSSVGSVDILGMVNPEGFNNLLDEPNIENLKLNVTDRMLASVLAGQMDKLLTTGEGGFANIKVKLDALTFIRKQDDANPQNLYALIVAEVDIRDMLGSLGKDSLVNKIAAGMLPDSILLTISVDVSPQLNARGARNEAEFVVNSCNNTDRVLAALEKLVPTLNLGDITKKIDDMLNGMLDELYKKLNVAPPTPSTYVYDKTLEEYIEGGNGGILVLPDIFSIVADTVLVRDGGSKVLSDATQLKNVIRDLNNPAQTTKNIAADYSEFIGQVVSKYYFNMTDAQKTVIGADFSALTSYLSDFSTTKFKITGEGGMAHDTTNSVQALRPIMTGAELGAIMLKQMGGNDSVKAYEIAEVKTGNNSLAITLSIALGDLLANAEQIRGMLSADKLFATATFTLGAAGTLGTGTTDDPYRYKVDIAVNVMNGTAKSVMAPETYNVMLDIVRFFAPAFNIQNQMNEIGVILYDQMKKLGESLQPTESAGGSTTSREYFFFTERGLEIVDFYTFIALKMQPSLLDTYTALDIKGMLQGLYKYDNRYPNAANYKESDIFFNRPAGGSGLANEGKWLEAEAVTFTGGGGTHIDKVFNGYLRYGVESISENSEVEVKQTVILAQNCATSGANAVRDWANAHIRQASDAATELKTSGQYLTVTFAMSMASFLNADSGNSAGAGLFPTEIYATIVYSYNGAQFAPIGDIVFNNMSNKQYAIMTSLMSGSKDSADSGKVNFKTISDQSAKVLNALAENGTLTLQAVAAGEAGIGKIVYSGAYGA